MTETWMTRWKNWKVEINQPPWSHDHSHLVTLDRLLETIRECGAGLTHYDNLCGVGGGNNELKGKVHKEVQPSINLHITGNPSDCPSYFLLDQHLSGEQQILTAAGQAGVKFVLNICASWKMTACIYPQSSFSCMVMCLQNYCTDCQIIHYG